MLDHLHHHDGILTQADLHKAHLQQHCGFCGRWIAEAGMIQTHIQRIHKDIASSTTAELRTACVASSRPTGALYFSWKRTVMESSRCSSNASTTWHQKYEEGTVKKTLLRATMWGVLLMEWKARLEKIETDA